MMKKSIAIFIFILVFSISNGFAASLPETIGTNFSEPGPWATAKGMSPDDSEVYMPAELGFGQVKHPIIAWANGTFLTPDSYDGLLHHLASYGFVVIASRSRFAGSGEQILEAVTWLIGQANDSESIYFNKLDIDNIGACGHSQGGGGVILAGADQRIKTTVPVEPHAGKSPGYKTAAANQTGSMFIIGGSNDAIVSAEKYILPNIYELTQVPTVFGILKGANHLTPLGDAEGMAWAIVAWFRLQLMGDDALETIFFGENCDLTATGLWKVYEKNTLFQY
ncbi:MAG: acetylxylan esterase [Desulfobacteraceae bacterium]|nr:acetylxylan esterase [Desulfobacteraceae bacterium]